MRCEKKVRPDHCQAKSNRMHRLKQEAQCSMELGQVAEGMRRQVCITRDFANCKDARYGS